MALNLTIDQGNRLTKLALWSSDGSLVDTTTRIRFVAHDVASFAEGIDIDTAIYCTVGHRPPTMLRALERRAAHVIEFSVNTPMPLGVDYATPATLGLDRLAAAVGAYSIVGAGTEILVVDLGTAITYDRVSPDGRYMGGNIAAGLYMRLKALNHYTARLPMVDPRTPAVPVWGKDTVSALRAGAIRGVVAELEYYRANVGADARVVLTGGDAELVAPLLSFDTTVEHNLVLAGLNHIIEFNRK